MTYLLPEVQFSQRHSFHKCFLGIKQRECIQVVFIERLQNLQPLGGWYVELPTCAWFISGVERLLISFKAPILFKNNAHRIFALLQKVSAVGSGVWTKATHLWFSIASPLRGRRREDIN